VVLVVYNWEDDKEEAGQEESEHAGADGVCGISRVLAR
jgi:hypothetical protein